MYTFGLDVGYSAVKATNGARRVSFPSVVGSPDKPSFSLNGDQTILLQVPGPALVGMDAVEQSRFISRREDRHWILSDEWLILAMAALSELNNLPWIDCTIVTGLPSSFYSDKDAVIERLNCSHTVKREGRQGQTVRVAGVRVIPQAFGAILSLALNDEGRIVDNALATGNVGVVDCGGKTTNILSVHALREVARETASVNTGAWDAVRALRGWLSEHYPDLELRDHEIVQAIISRQIKYFGQPVDLGKVIDEALVPMGEAIVSQASQLWNGGARLDTILISGGGALLLEPYIRRHFKHAQVAPDPVFANACGFWRFAQRLANGKTQ